MKNLLLFIFLLSCHSRGKEKTVEAVVQLTPAKRKPIIYDSVDHNGDTAKIIRISSFGGRLIKKKDSTVLESFEQNYKEGDLFKDNDGRTYIFKNDHWQLKTTQ